MQLAEDGLAYRSVAGDLVVFFIEVPANGFLYCKLDQSSWLVRLHDCMTLLALLLLCCC